MKDFPVREFMVIQEENYSVEVRIIPGKDFTKESFSQIRTTIEQNLPGLLIEFSLVDSVPKTQANKWRPVITRVIPSKAAPID